MMHDGLRTAPQTPLRVGASPPQPTWDGTAPAEWDASSCAAFVDATYARTYAWLYGMTRRADVAADLTQEAFAAFWAGRGRPIRLPQVWLLRIARNVWRRWRRDLRRAERDRREVRVGACERREYDGAGQEAHAVRDAVAGLPLAYREAITLHYWCELTAAQIAVVQAAPAALVRWRLHRARGLLRAALGGDPGIERSEDAS